MTSNTIPPTYVSLTTRTRMEAGKGKYNYIIFFEHFFSISQENNSASYSTAASLSCDGRRDIHTLMLRPGDATSISRTASINANCVYAMHQKKGNLPPRRMVNALHVLTSSHPRWKRECCPERWPHAHYSDRALSQHLANTLIQPSMAQSGHYVQH